MVSSAADGFLFDPVNFRIEIVSSERVSLETEGNRCCDTILLAKKLG
jgi:hypothetical protein